VVVFKRFRREHLPLLLDHACAQVVASLRSGGFSSVELSLEDSLREALLAKAERRIHLGARPLMRNVRKYILFPLADLTVSGALRDGVRVVLGIENGHSTARVEMTAALPASPPLQLLPGKTRGGRARGG